MNEAARDALVDAAMRGVRQIRGASFDDKGGMCAVAVLMKAGAVDSLGVEVRLCPYDCGKRGTEFVIIVHMNDVHGDDFLTIARKLGPDA